VGVEDNRREGTEVFEEVGGEMTETKLAIARRIILSIGLFVCALLFLYPHWRGSFILGENVFEYGLGRGFITAPPIPEPGQLVRLIGMESYSPDDLPPLHWWRNVIASYRVHRVRQITEIALTLLFTFGLMRALRKSLGG
jgi:hypothetical protein